MRQPEIYTARSIMHWDVMASRDGERYLPCRPEGHNLHPLSHRFRAAWLVFVGRLDALDWQEPPR